MVFTYANVLQADGTGALKKLQRWRWVITVLKCWLMQLQRCPFPFSVPPLSIFFGVVNILSLESWTRSLSSCVYFLFQSSVSKTHRATLLRGSTRPWRWAMPLFRLEIRARMYLISNLCSPHLCRGPGPKTRPWFGSWCPALRLTCWIFDRSMWGTMGNHCTQISL